MALANLLCSERGTGEQQLASYVHLPGRYRHSQLVENFRSNGDFRNASTDKLAGGQAAHDGKETAPVPNKLHLTKEHGHNLQLKAKAMYRPGSQRPCQSNCHPVDGPEKNSVPLGDL